MVCSRLGSWVCVAELAAESMARLFHLEVVVGFESASQESLFVVEVVGGLVRAERTLLEIPSEFRLKLAVPRCLLQVLLEDVVAAEVVAVLPVAVVVAAVVVVVAVVGVVGRQR